MGFVPKIKHLVSCILYLVNYIDFKITNDIFFLFFFSYSDDCLHHKGKSFLCT